MPYTAPTTRATSDLITASIWNTDLVNNVAFLANPPSCRVFHNAAQSTTTGLETALAFNSERYDTDTMHDTVTLNTRITIKTAGLYVITGAVQFAANTTGLRQVGIRANGGAYLAVELETAVASPSMPLLTVTTIYKMAVADYLELVAYQSSGGALNVNNVAAYSPEFAATWIGLG